MKTPTRKQLLETAWLANDGGSLGLYEFPVKSETNPIFRGVRLWYIQEQGYFARNIGAMYASMLMSEAHRPAGHDGDGSDEL